VPAHLDGMEENVKIVGAPGLHLGLNPHGLCQRFNPSTSYGLSPLNPRLRDNVIDTHVTLIVPKVGTRAANGLGRYQPRQGL
jgi:hypothetical protein